MAKNFSKVLSAHQPCYLPWLGYVDKIISSDVFVSMDDVKFSKNSMYARNYIIISGKKTMLTVPIDNLDKNKMIKDVKISGSEWAEKHLKKIKLGYSKSLFYKNYIEDVEKIYLKKWKWLCDLNLELLFFIKEIFFIKTDLKKASDFFFDGDKNSRLINYCKKFEANRYIFGKNGINYADDHEFLKNEIEIIFQEFACPNNNLCFLDYAFNFGPKKCETFGGRK